ncbi:MAG: fold-4 domain protein [Gemmatimonadetes bacterium]|nr:fold-4 domain protein [Gemmatimonadota bacterium]
MRRPQSVGVFTTDRALVVQSWDAWIAQATGIPESAAAGQPLSHLYPELAERGLLARLRRVAEGSGVDVLAPAFHKYLLPCPPRDRTSRFERMRQHVTMAPLRNHDGVAGVIVTIEDVTERFDRERRLAADLDSHDESVRLRAAKSLAAGGESPALLANALTDASWRVRRVAAEAMAEGGGREVTETLIEALREHHRNPALLNAALTALTRSRADVVSMVVPLLDTHDAEVRTYAALALGLMDDSRAVPALIAHLGDDDVNVRFHVIEALGRIGDRDAADAIATVAESGDFFLAFAALDALAAIGEPHVAARLLPLLDDEMLLPATAACLGAIGAEDVAIPLARLTADDRIPVAPIALALADVHDRMESEFGEGALIADFARSVMTADSARFMIAALPDASVEELRGLVIVLSWLPFEGIDRALAQLLTHDAVRSIVADRIAGRGVAAAAHIEEAARDAADDVRKAAAFALGRIGCSASVPTLVAWLHEHEPDVVIAVAGALGAIGDRRAFTPLLAVLDHPEAAVRQAAVSALNSIGHPQMEMTVAGRLSDDSPRVRESAARIAGYFGYASCLRRMVELCDDPDPVVRRACVESLANYDQRPAWSKIHETVTSDSDATVRAAATRALGQSASDDSLRTLVTAARDPNLWVRYFAARAMSRRGTAHADVLTALAECATRDQAVPVRIAAIEALGALRASTMLCVLLPLVRDPETGVACATIATLGDFDTGETRAALAFALSEDEVARQRAALDAVGRQRAEHAVDAVQAIARATRDSVLRAHAVQTLAAIGNTAAIHALTTLGTDRRLRELVVAALAGLTEEQVPALRDEMTTAVETVRELVVEAFGRMKHSAAGRCLAGALDDPSAAVRLAAARALGRLDLRDARSQLAALARTDESPAVRLAARDALARG